MNTDQNSIQIKFKKALGQLTKVQQMHDSGEYCIDIVYQNLAVMGILRSIQQELIEHHLHHCFKEGTADPERRDEMIEELIKVLKFYNK